MPIGVVSDEDFEKELESFTNKVHRITPSSNPTPIIPIDGEVVDMEKPGRKEGDTNIPNSLRALIGEEQLINGRPAALALAQDFGISDSSVSAYANGATSTASYDKPKPAIIGQINKARQKAISRAQKTLNSALSAITQEKLDYTDAKDLSVIAKNMSAIVKDLEPEKVKDENEDDKPKVQFVIYAPQFKQDLSKYEVVDAIEG